MKKNLLLKKGFLVLLTFAYSVGMAQQIPLPELREEKERIIKELKKTKAQIPSLTLSCSILSEKIDSISSINTPKRKKMGGLKKAVEKMLPEEMSGYSNLLLPKDESETIIQYENRKKQHRIIKDSMRYVLFRKHGVEDLRNELDKNLLEILALQSAQKKEKEKLKTLNDSVISLENALASLNDLSLKDLGKADWVKKNPDVLSLDNFIIKSGNMVYKTSISKQAGIDNLDAGDANVSMIEYNGKQYASISIGGEYKDYEVKSKAKYIPPQPIKRISKYNAGSKCFFLTNDTYIWYVKIPDVQEAKAFKMNWMDYQVHQYIDELVIAKPGQSKEKYVGKVCGEIIDKNKGVLSNLKNPGGPLPDATYCLFNSERIVIDHPAEESRAVKEMEKAGQQVYLIEGKGKNILPEGFVNLLANIPDNTKTLAVFNVIPQERPQSPSNKPEIVSGDTVGYKYIMDKTRMLLHFYAEIKDQTKASTISAKVEFYVDMHGNVSDCRLLEESESESYNKLVLDVISKLPTFEKPGKFKGIPVLTQIILPISFRIR